MAHMELVEAGAGEEVRCCAVPCRAVDEEGEESVGKGGKLIIPRGHGEKKSVSKTA